LDELLAIRSAEVDAWLGRALRIQASEGFKNLFQLRGQWQKELDATRDRSVRRRQPVVGVMRRRSPIQPGLRPLPIGPGDTRVPRLPYDPSSDRYRGIPLAPWWPFLEP
jgi:hypothetical protein